MTHRVLRSSGLMTLALLSMSTLGACSAGGGQGEGDGALAVGDSDLRILSVSTRAHLVTGGDVLLRVDVGGDLDASQVEVLRNGDDVTEAFRSAEHGSGLVGLVEGLRKGDNEIEARIRSDGPSAKLQVTNYSISGPIISGPHQTPFLCQTEDFTTAGGATLGAPLDENCSVTTRVEYVYLSTLDHEFKPYLAAAGGAMPSDVAEATTLDGVTVPFIVRVQTGTVNRAIYQSSMLHDPTDPAPDPWTRSRGWNGKLVYTHGGGCRNGWFRQGARTGAVLQEGLLEMGYAVTSASFNVFGQNCNDLLASEANAGSLRCKAASSAPSTRRARGSDRSPIPTTA